MIMSVVGTFWSSQFASTSAYSAISMSLTAACMNLPEFSTVCTLCTLCTLCKLCTQCIHCVRTVYTVYTVYTVHSVYTLHLPIRAIIYKDTILAVNRANSSTIYSVDGNGIKGTHCCIFTTITPLYCRQLHLHRL